MCGWASAQIYLLLSRWGSPSLKSLARKGSLKRSIFHGYKCRQTRLSRWNIQLRFTATDVERRNRFACLEELFGVLALRSKQDPDSSTVPSVDFGRRLNGDGDEQGGAVQLVSILEPRTDSTR
jgi:hypothetical protein